MVLVHIQLVAILGWLIETAWGYPLTRRMPQLLLMPESEAQYGYAKMDFNVVKRDAMSKVDLTLKDYKDLYYLVDIEIGTPRQSIKAMLDTGSSDIILESLDNPQCQPTKESKAALEKIKSGNTNLLKRKNIVADRNSNPILPQSNSVATDGVQLKAVDDANVLLDCFRFGFVAANLSSTFHANVSEPIEIQYVDGETSSGYFATDDASIGGVEVANLNFGLVQKGTTALSVLGIGNKYQQSQYSSRGFLYDSLPYQISQQKNLKKTAYSIALGLEDGQKGSIIFGGIDSSKVDGEWETLPYKPYQGKNGFYIPVDGVELYFEGKNSSDNSNVQKSSKRQNSNNNQELKFRESSKQITALLDTGSTLTSLPEKIFKLIGTYIPNLSVSKNGYIIDCSYMENPNNFFRYTFNKKLGIDVPFKHFNLEIGKNGDKCTLGLSTSPDQQSAILGDSFFRLSYVVFNLDDKTISVAQLKKELNSATEKVELIM